VRVQQRQCFFGILPHEILLAVCQVGVGKVIVRVGGVGISQQIELEELNGILDVASALIVLADDVTGDLGPQLRLRIVAPGVQQLLPDLGHSAGNLQLVQDWRGCVSRSARTGDPCAAL
jgi:hypothetical protein